MKSHVNLILALATVAPIILSSCASTGLSHVWQDESFAGGPLKKILVVAVRTNQERRQVWEDGFVSALVGHGVAAVPSYRAIGMVLPDTGRIAAAAREEKCDGVLLVGRLSKTTYESATARIDLSSRQSPSGRWSGWDYADYDRANYPGYPIMDETVKEEVSVWAVQGGGQLVWRGVGEAVDREGSEDTGGMLISLFVPELVKRRVVGSGS